jgi:murein L,D-transpeptidase YafK
MRPILLLLGIFWGLASQAGMLIASQNETPAETAEEEKIYPANLIALSNNDHFSQIAFVVDKTARTLRVYQADGDLPKLLEEHPTDIGKNTGAKERANDGKTPVGIYFLQAKKTQPEIPFGLYGSCAFTTDYPNIFDRREEKGGSGIWLHAVPDQVPLTRGSRGCVVVRNEVIKLLGKYVKLGQTPLLIAQKVDYLDKQTYLDQRQKYLSFFEQWRKSWQDSDVETYIQFYDSTFRNSQMNFNQWYKHKKKLKGLYKFIKVDLLPPTILRNGDQVVIRTIQDYKSDLHKDYGEKTLHAYFSDAVGFKIIREDWRPLKKEPALAAPTTPPIPPTEEPQAK